VALTRYNTDDRLTRVTPEFCRRTIREVEKLQKEFRSRLGVTFAFLGDEIYIKAGMPIPSRRHYGNYPQIEDGVGMIRSFLNSFEKLARKLEKSGPAAVSAGSNVRTNPLAMVPEKGLEQKELPGSMFGTILTGEMFAPILRDKVDELNTLLGSRLSVLAVPNTYFGGDVAVAGLLTAQDFLAVRDRLEGDFAIIPKNTIKSDEPIFLDGVSYDDLKRQFPIPVYDLDIQDLIQVFSKK
jgi:NifB/MoaA-like Fe-S oxidoreductase